MIEGTWYSINIDPPPEDEEKKMEFERDSKADFCSLSRVPVSKIGVQIRFKVVIPIHPRIPPFCGTSVDEVMF